jgi:DNA polymerase-3 subunit delta
MPAKKKAAAKKTSAAPAGNVHAFIGSDEAKAKEAALALSKKLVVADDEFGLEVIAGGADNSDHASRIVGQAIEALQTLPFFGGGKTVWLQAANFFGDSVTGRAQATVAAVENLTAVLDSGFPADIHFILSATEMDKRRTFFKKLQKIAKIEVFDKVDVSRVGWERQIESTARKRAQVLGMTFAPGALERFVQLVGADTRQLQNELEKLDLYLGSARRQATDDDVRAIVGSTHAGIIFEIGDAVARRNLPLALELIDQQLQRGENAIGLLYAAIIPKVRAMLHARDFMERHGINGGGNFKNYEASLNRLPGSETGHLPRKKDGNISCYPLFLATENCRRFTLDQLLAAHDACLEASLRLVTTGLDPRLVLSQLVTRILVAEKKPQRVA